MSPLAKIDIWAHQAIFFIQDYGWYILFTIIALYMTSPFIIASYNALLVKFESKERRRLLDEERNLIRRRQQEQIERTLQTKVNTTSENNDAEISTQSGGSTSITKPPSTRPAAARHREETIPTLHLRRNNPWAM